MSEYHENCAPSAFTKVPYSMENNAANHPIQCSIELAEPVLFQKGFNLGCQSSVDQEQEAILRGKLVLRVAKPVKLEAINMDFTGSSRTERHRGRLPETYGQFEDKDFIKHSWLFFDARRSCPPQRAVRDLHEDGSTPPGLGTVYEVYTPVRPSSIQSDSDSSNTEFNLDQHATEQKYLLFQSGRFRKLTAAKRPHYQLFVPGIYEFFIEFPMPRTCPETVKLRGRYVHYQLEAWVKLKRVFTANIHKTKEVILVRVPDLDLMDQAGPIVIDKTWKDQLHYNLAICSKSFPVGSKIPITIRLSSSKIRCHSLQVYLTENIEFLGHGEHSYRRAPQRKIKLLETSVESRYLGGFGDVGVDALVENLTVSSRALGTAEAVELEKSSMATALGDTIDLVLKHCPRKIELQVQLPFCRRMRESEPAQRINLDTLWDNVNVSHWINVVLSLHRSEPDGPSKIKRQCYDISIDHPIHILSCYATSLNTLLPAYSSIYDATIARTFECGCPDAVSKDDSQSTRSPVIIPGIINTSGRQHIVDQGSIMGRFQSSASPSQSDLDSEIQRSMAEPALLWHYHQNILM